MISISSNGSTAGTGIIWATHPIHGDANHAVVPGELQAFDATDVTHELWNSNMSAIRDSVGKFAKYCPPTIANGKVYLSTFSNKLHVYGLNAPSVSHCPNPLPSPLVSAYRLFTHGCRGMYVIITVHVRLQI
jgi:outer membrane protein assembly factor BamB